MFYYFICVPKNCLFMFCPFLRLQFTCHSLAFCFLKIMCFFDFPDIVSNLICVCKTFSCLIFEIFELISFLRSYQHTIEVMIMVVCFL